MDERSQLLIKKFLRTFARRAEIFNLPFLPPEWDERKCLHKWQSISRIATMIYAKVRTAPRASFTLFKDLHRRRDIWRQKVCEQLVGGGVAYSILHALLKPQCRQLKRILLPPAFAPIWGCHRSRAPKSIGRELPRRMCQKNFII